MLCVRELRREVNERIILTDITFTLKRGDILFVRGPSGVGKSLLLRALAYLDPIQVNRKAVSLLSQVVRLKSLEFQFESLFYASRVVQLN